MRPQFAVIVMVAVVMAVLSALLGSYTWGIVAPGLSARRAISGGAFHLAVTAAQAVLWWRFTEGAQLPPALWIAYALFGGVARGSLRVWTILESDSETAAAAIQAAELASRPMELLAYRCFYAFVLIWQVLIPLVFFMPASAAYRKRSENAQQLLEQELELQALEASALIAQRGQADAWGDDEPRDGAPMQIADGRPDQPPWR
ncbi:hypothetical protein FNF31_06435 [Cafeteria roenbergensis]|uniref:Uncharacterized protein n=1 Tax=Cafeteria roenbergensis TaxID=33653 RepID=A0A5A8CKV7_CAFRO|nr:hypothetical protein FNF31_06435 [Cafeteria roenbergensis]